MDRYVMCPNCGHRMNRLYDSWGNWDGETYYCKYCADQYDDYSDDDIQEGCAACGGDYPNCTTSCPMFDD